MQIIPKITSIMATIALASTAFAADPDAAALEKSTFGHWAPDGKALLKHYTEDMGMEEKDAEALLGESASMTVRVEKGTVHLHTKQGILSVSYKLVDADGEKKTLTLRPDMGPDADAAQAMKIRIEKDRIFLEDGPTKFILKRIGQDEFNKRVKDLPDHEVGG
ncbi:MAG: hypothetical protein R3242_06545 [Akkermansiaceae bacterium]|nr:hypothetical protein [Akkermansiaceae bacterium]